MTRWEVLVLRELLAGPATCPQLTERFACDRRYTEAAMKALYTRSNALVRVSGWFRRPGAAQGRDVPIWCLSDGLPDAPRLPAKTRAQAEADYRARDPEGWKAKHRAANKRLRKRDPTYFQQASKRYRLRQKRSDPFAHLIDLTLKR